MSSPTRTAPTDTTGRSRKARLVAAAAAAVVALFTAAAGATAAAPAGQNHVAAGTTTATTSRTEVIARALSWVAQRVPYSQTRWWSDGNGTYRQDCSGYVAMAWGLDQDTNYWTGNLATVAHRIPSSDLRPGDILLLPGRHTVIFAGWANAERTSFHHYEQFAPGYAARYVAGASLYRYLNQGYGVYRYNRITG